MSAQTPLVVPIDEIGRWDTANPVVLFLGVETSGSRALQLVPQWTAGAAEAVGVDAPLGTPLDRFAAFAEVIRAHPRVAGAVVTTHKLALFAAIADRVIASPTSTALREANVLRSRNGRVECDATDPVAARIALGRLGAPLHDVLCFGAGGAGLALVHAIGDRRPGARVVVADVDEGRIAHLEVSARGADVDLEAVLVATPADNAVLLDGGAWDLVVNATGLGKLDDRSPLPPGTLFPADTIVWDLNYRGPLPFLATVEARRRVDGWDYFLEGWASCLGFLWPGDAGLAARIRRTAR